MAKRCSTLAPLCALLVSAPALSACVATNVVDLDERFDRGWRPSRAYCAFGAETPKLAAWCADLNFGREGLLSVARAVNREVLERAAGRALPCTEHVASARRGMAEYPGYALTELYSCDAEPALADGRAVCHVSLLVTSLAGARVVLDNGHVLEPATTDGVAGYRQFAALVDRHWVGRQPDGIAVAASHAADGQP
jgi:hypothetical protein